MHKVQVEINSGNIKSISTLSEIEYELRQLREQAGYDLEFTLTHSTENITFGVLNSSRNEGFFRKTYIQEYYIAVEMFDRNNAGKSYGRFINNFDEIIEHIQNFVTFQKLPDYSNWEVIEW